MFLAHVNDLANGQWQVYPQLKDWALFNDNGSYRLSSNICPHQGSYFQGTQGRKVRLCPFHGWSFNCSGEPIGSGTTNCKNEKRLELRPVYEWNGFLFSEPVDLPNLPFINTEHLVLAHTETVIVRAGFMKIMNLFLDVDHIPVVHPKVYDEINVPNINQIGWIHKTNSLTQLVPTVLSDTEFTETLLEQDKTSSYGAAWFAVYPYTMLEYQPGAWFITVADPIDENTTSVQVYKYRDTRYSSNNWNINETVWDRAFQQDCQQAEQLSNKIFYENLEPEKKHYVDWINNRL